MCMCVCLCVCVHVRAVCLCVHGDLPGCVLLMIESGCISLFEGNFDSLASLF